MTELDRSQYQTTLDPDRKPHIGIRQLLDSTVK